MFIVNQWWSSMRIMRFLCEINPGKSWSGIRQEGGRERQREKDLGREGEQHSGERKQRGLILTVGPNQQCLLTLNTWEFINRNNRWIIFQSNFWVVFCISHLIWLYSIRSNNTKSTTTRANNTARLTVQSCSRATQHTRAVDQMTLDGMPVDQMTRCPLD